jgi:hypothetical protein
MDTNWLIQHLANIQSDGKLHCLQSPSRTGFLKPRGLWEPKEPPLDRADHAPESTLYDVRFSVPSMPLPSQEVGQLFVDFLQ